MNGNATIETVLDRHAGLIYKFAHQYTTPKWGVDDLMQEARIALWRETQKRPGDNLDKLASYVIKRRIMKLAYDEGAPFAHREEGERSYSPKEMTSLEGLAARIGGDDTNAAIFLAQLVGTAPSAEHEVIQKEAAAELAALAAAGKLREPEPSKYTHGTETCYRHMKCRCGLCKEEHARLKREYRERKKATAATA